MDTAAAKELSSQAEGRIFTNGNPVAGGHAALDNPASGPSIALAAAHQADKTGVAYDQALEDMGRDRGAAGAASRGARQADETGDAYYLNVRGTAAEHSAASVRQQALHQRAEDANTCRGCKHEKKTRTGRATSRNT